MKRVLLLLLLALAACGDDAAANGGFIRLGGGITSGGSGLQLTTNSLSTGAVGSSFSGTLTATGGAGGDAFSLVGCTPFSNLWQVVLPNGQLVGRSTTNETETCTYQVTDSSNATAQSTITFATAASGSLSVVTPTTIPVAAVSGGYFYYPIAIQGGVPPYGCSGYAAQPWQITQDCIVEGTPTSTGPVTFSTQTITDSVGHTTTYTPTVTVGSTLTMRGIDPTINLLRLPPAVAGDYWQAQLICDGGTGTYTAYTALSGLPSWATQNSTTGLISGIPTASGAVEISEQCTDSASSHATATALLNVSSSKSVSRPSWNSSTSNGFFVLNGKLYDPNGHYFALRGVNKNHDDSASWASGANGALSGANAVRAWMGFGPVAWGGNQTPAQMATQLTDEFIDNGIFPIVTVSSIPASVTETAMASTATGNSTTVTVSAFGAVSTANAGIMVTGMVPASGITCTGSALSTITAGPSNGLTGTYTIGVTGGSGSCSGSAGTVTWGVGTADNTDPNAIVGSTNMIAYALANGLSAIQADLSFNIANEWGVSPIYGKPNTEANWQSYYTTAVAALRTAGFNGPVIVDTLNNGEDTAGLFGGNAAAILASDSFENVLFSMHLYNTSNTLGQITNITKGTNAVITFNSSASSNPFGAIPNFFGEVYVSGVSGMTQINGQTVAVTGVGGSSGAWTISTSLDTSGYTAYSSGGIVYDIFNYQVRFQQLAAFIAAGLPVMVGEYGPPGLNNTTVGLSTFRAAAITYGISDINWAWDDTYGGPGGNQAPWSGGFDITGPAGTSYYNGQYVPSVPSSLTAPGMDVVLNPVTGLQSQGVPATVLH